MKKSKRVKSSGRNAKTKRSQKKTHLRKTLNKKVAARRKTDAVIRTALKKTPSRIKKKRGYGDYAFTVFLSQGAPGGSFSAGSSGIFAKTATEALDRYLFDKKKTGAGWTASSTETKKTAHRIH